MIKCLKIVQKNKVSIFQLRTANITIPSVHELNVNEGNFARHHGQVVQLLSNSAVHLKCKKRIRL